MGYTSEFLFGIYWWTLKNPKNQTWSWSYAILFLRYMVCDGCHCYFSMSAIFCSFTPLTALKKKIWKKRKKKKQQQQPEDIIILHKCTKNHDHMLCCSWDIWCVMDVIVIFHFGLFLPFYPPNIPKNENFKKMKKRKKNTWRYHQFTQVHHKSWSYAILFLGYGVRQIFHFGPFFALLAP